MDSTPPSHSENLNPSLETGKKDNLKKLLSLDGLKSELVTTISRELKTSLGLASGYVTMLEDMSLGKLNEEQIEALGTIKKQLSRISQKNQNLAQIAQLALSLPKSLIEEVDLGRLLEAEYIGFKQACQRKRLNIQVDIEPRLPVILGHQDFIGDVLRRLIDNAVHYTDSGGNVRISIQNRQEGKYGAGIYIEIKDSGCGIDERLAPTLFDRFSEFRDIQHHSSGRSGLGLGLAICRHIVELHQGKIWVKSKVNQGSTFFVFFPVP